MFIEDRFDDNGKWMDGWESRRKCALGHDFAVIRLAVAGDPDDATEWTEVLGTSPLRPNADHYLASQPSDIFTHVRLNIFPNGGAVAEN